MSSPPPNSGNLACDQNEVLHGWTDVRVSIKEVPPVLQKTILRLVHATGLGYEPILAVVSSFVTALVGPSRWICAPGHGRLPLSLNFAFVTETLLPLAGVIRQLFQPLSDHLAKTLRMAALDDPHRREENLLQLRLQVLQNQDLINRGVPLPSAAAAPPKNEVEEMRAQTTAFEAKLRQSKAVQDRPRFLAQLARAEFRARPGIVGEALGPDELLYPGLLAFDNAVTNISCGGETLRSLSRAKPEILRHLGRLLRASWHGAPEIGLRQQQVGRALVSQLWIVERATLTAARSDQHFRDVELLDTFMFIDADKLGLDAPPDHVDPIAPEGQYLQTANLLLAARVDGGETNHLLDEAAEQLFLEFRDEINSLLATLTSVARRHAIHWAEWALKLALALHLGGHDTRPPEPPIDKKPAESVPTVVQPGERINAATMRTAVKIVKRLAVGHLGLLSETIKGKSADPAIRANVVEHMVAKLQKSGPQTERSLFRRYHRQNGATLGPILADAIKLGRVRREGHLLAAVPSPASPNVSEKASASACQPCQPS